MNSSREKRAENYLRGERGYSDSMTLPANDHPWKYAWKAAERTEEETGMTGSSPQGTPGSPYPSQDTVSEWLSQHASDMIDCPLGPVGVHIQPYACAARQRVFADSCTCAHPPVPSRERTGTLLGDADHFKLKGKRGSLAQKYGRKAADAFTQAAAPEENTGSDDGGGTRHRHGDTRYVQDREAENWARDNDDRMLIRDIIRGRVGA